MTGPELDHRQAVTTKGRGLHACIVCQCDQLSSVMDLGVQPLANDYVSEPGPQSQFPLHLVECLGCRHLQLSYCVHPDEMFRNYLYVSGTTTTLRNHFEELVSSLLQDAPAHCDVLDIASNDGTLLQAFRERGCVVQGVEPARNLARICRDLHDISVVSEYWTPDLAKQMRRRFDIITATNVLAHTDNPRAFLIACNLAVKSSGSICIECPYALRPIENKEWDTIYHEHISYFFVGPLMQLATACGLGIVDIKEVPIHGGSLRIVMRPDREHCAVAHRMAELERSCTVRSLEQEAHKQVAELRHLLEQWSPKAAIGYGASAKGNTLLNFGHLRLSMIVDDNSNKWNRFTPGRQIPIYSPDTIGKLGGDILIVVLAWNFWDEIVRRAKVYRQGRGDMIATYVPEVYCHALNATDARVE